MTCSCHGTSGAGPTAAVQAVPVPGAVSAGRTGQFCAAACSAVANLNQNLLITVKETPFARITGFWRITGLDLNRGAAASACLLGSQVLSKISGTTSVMGGAQLLGARLPQTQAFAGSDLGQLLDRAAATWCLLTP